MFIRDSRRDDRWLDARDVAYTSARHESSAYFFFSFCLSLCSPDMRSREKSKHIQAYYIPVRFLFILFFFCYRGAYAQLYSRSANLSFFFRPVQLFFFHTQMTRKEEKIRVLRLPGRAIIVIAFMSFFGLHHGRAHSFAVLSRLLFIARLYVYACTFITCIIVYNFIRDYAAKIA